MLLGPCRDGAGLLRGEVCGTLWVQTGMNSHDESNGVARKRGDKDRIRGEEQGR